MVVLTHYELERVYVDGVGVAARGHHLPVVVLVHECVDGAVVERAVEGRVEGVVHEEEERQRQQRVAHLGRG